MGASPSTVRFELVEACPERRSRRRRRGLFFFPVPTKEGQGFDKLSPNGVDIVALTGICCE